MKVRIKAVSRFQIVDGAPEEQVHAGYAQLEAPFALTYSEQSEEGEIRICLTRNGNTFRMERTGETRGALDFCAGQRTQGLYVTPYGDFDLELETRKAELEETAGTGQLLLVYDMYIGGALQQHCSYELTWRT